MQKLRAVAGNVVGEPVSTQIGLRQGVPCKKVRAQALNGDLAVVEDHRVVAQPEGLGDVLLDQHDGELPVLKGSEQLVELLDDLRG